MAVLSHLLQCPIAVYEIETVMVVPGEEASAAFPVVGADNDCHISSSFHNNNDNETTTIQLISCRGIFGGGGREDSAAAADDAIIAIHERRNILILNTGTKPNEKHACALIPVTTKTRHSSSNTTDTT
jgi:hypothetical protein